MKIVEVYKEIQDQQMNIVSIWNKVKYGIMYVKVYLDMPVIFLPCTLICKSLNIDR